MDEQSLGFYTKHTKDRLLFNFTLGIKTRVCLSQIWACIRSGIPGFLRVLYAFVAWRYFTPVIRIRGMAHFGLCYQHLKYTVQYLQVAHEMSYH